ncbi:Pre-mRNA-splicing factor Cwf15/Cwc15 [Rhodotorula diobovata]|uniref:Pre-mRNA-splicing factor Cwf15/Cwc15 n=1 Tax=Rhodotorula diobovata TaxID=5288 RepID=A0A5C5FRW1_9BASI|nr:Pre-mRNA-splicing factor Cwf15/Cwc15 [Rhodotorula diobovata]
MSSAHRPTWAPAQGKEGRQNSRSYSARDLASHTRLKFRQPGQGTQSEHARRDLKLELLRAEQDASARKARGEKGYVQDTKLLLLKEEQDRAESDAQSEVAHKRQRMLQEAADLDKDDSEEDEDEDDAEGASRDEGAAGKGKDKGKAVDGAGGDDDDDDDSDDDSDDDEDETAELLRELEKIKKERAEEKERLERERAANEQVSRDEEIATGNPLLNLQAALGASPAPSTLSSSTAPSSASFGVKRRFGDDAIFKNQARGVDDKKQPTWVNDVGRSQYHRKFMSKYIA